MVEIYDPLSGAVQTLGISHKEEAGTKVAAELEAVRRLSEAPPGDPWDRGLLLGLHSRRPEVVDATVHACAERLRTLDDPESQDGFLTAILDSCFLHLPVVRTAQSKQSALSHPSAVVEQAAGRLILTVGRVLRHGDSRLEHHRARLLARARQIKHRAGWGFLAEAIVGLQADLTLEEGSDAAVTAELIRLRKLDVYTSPQSSEQALMAYLELDRQLEIEKVSQELWQAYRILLAVQTKEMAGRAILQTLENLTHWLDRTPQSAQEHESVLPEVIQMARMSVPRDQLSPVIGRHLEAHLELLPGSHDPEDLLCQLISRYDSAEGEPILVKGLGLLRRLPLVRNRSTEICEFILAPARRQRGGETWKALFELVESLLTGLSDIVASPEPSDAREQRRQKLLRELLVHDLRFREMLYRLATDQDLRLSHDPQVETMARETAWRVLLRSLPPERIERQREGLLQHSGSLFQATLEEAGKGHRRELWEALVENWQVILDANLSKPARHERILAIASFFRQTQDYSALREESGGLGPLLSLAFDDPDLEARSVAEAALVEAGFGMEVERERERRRLLELRESLSNSNQQIIALEAEISRLSEEATHCQVRRTERSLSIQDLLQEREGQLTDGWIFTSVLQVDLEEVRTELVEALARADDEMELLVQLRQQMQREQVSVEKTARAVRDLVRQQEQKESELQQLHARLRQAEARRAQAAREVESLERERARLASNPPQRPSPTGDAEDDRARIAEYQRSTRRHSSRLQGLTSRIRQAGSEARTAAQEIDGCRSQIRRVEGQLERLQAQVDQLKARVRELRQRIESLGRDMDHREASLARLRRDVEALGSRSRQLQARQESHSVETRQSLAANTQEIEEEQRRLREVQAELQEISSALNRTGDQRDRQVTESQRLSQAIESGREQYDRVAERAIPESGQADLTGHAKREAHKRELTQAQEGRLQYAEGLHHALRLEKPLEARTPKRKTTSESHRRKTHTPPRGNR